MVKKNNQEIKKQLTPAYKGSISTIIITVFILGFGWFFPMVIADRLEGARRGETMFVDLTPQEIIFWDINSNSDLETTELYHRSYTQPQAGRYEWQQRGAPGYIGTYRSPFDSGFQFTNVAVNNFWIYNGVKPGTSMITTARNPCNDLALSFIDANFPEKSQTVDNYITANLVPDIKGLGTIFQHYLQSGTYANKGYYSESDERFRNEGINIFGDLDINLWTDQDATKIDFFWKFYSNLPWVQVILYAQSLWSGDIVALYGQFHQVTSNPMTLFVSETITLTDLIDIQNLETNHGDIALRFIVNGAKTGSSTDQRRAHFTPNSNIIFDAQVYGLVTPDAPEKPFMSAMDRFSIYMILQSLGLIVIGLAMLPQFTMGGIFRRVGILKKNE